MKKKVLLSIMLLSGSIAFAQKDNVGIGTTKPDQSAILDVNSSNKGLLMPRMTLSQRSNISNPAEGLVVYQTDFISGFYFYDGESWKPLSISEKSVAGTDGDWTNIGNAGLTAGTHFVGTTDAVPLELRMNNVRSGYIDGFTGRTILGYNAAIGNTATNIVAVGQASLGTGGTGNTGGSNLAVGYQALNKNTSGYQNIGMGVNALYNNQSGANNTAIGASTLFSNLSGINNTGIGFQALNKTTGNDNMAIGVNALYNNTTGFLNTAIGNYALTTNQTGSGNTAIGSQALMNSTGVGNLALGVNALLDLSTGGSNTAVGNYAGINKNGSGNIYIGYEAGKTAAATAESNKLYIANAATDTPLIYGDFSTKYLAVGEVAATDRAAATSGGYRLLVKGGMITEKIKVAVAGTADWADYVFEPSYKLMSLDQIESFVKENKHLPNVPSAEDMHKNGIDVTQTSAKLMEKIEELTLYMIEMNKEIKSLKAENEQLKKEVRK